LTFITGSGVMLQVKVVKTSKELDAIEQQQDIALDKEVLDIKKSS
jgi:hypothetical protein